ncbi:MAG: DEAD/DEAH box helicase family protein, partial [Patescibacteria group bacterium]|nr:DEAD/DEAH box helicase family protein [Patescibacteria group bacterium]
MLQINELTTRKMWIDEKLKKSGWDSIIPYHDGLDTSALHKTAVEEFVTSTGPVDYALFANGKIVAFVEAKKLGVSPQNVLTQAQRYVKGAEQDGRTVPFIYSTNGESIWFQDLRITPSRSRPVQEFHTPKALIEYLTNPTHENVRWFTENPANYAKLRDYQRDAINAIEKAITDNKRSMLVAMATGTGKTFTVASLIYRLLKSGVSKRILFLVDRKALAAQTVMEFAAYEAENGLKFNQIYQVYSQKFKMDDVESNEKFDFNVIPTGYLTDPDGNQVFVYVSTIQRMQINLYGRQGMFSSDGDYDEDDDADKIDIPINAFDTI